RPFSPNKTRRCQPYCAQRFRPKNFFGEPRVALVDSLLTAIVRADGDALVLHAGERPYVVAPSGQSELASRVLTLDAMIGMVGELLPDDPRRTLDEVGAVQHELGGSPVS